MSNNSVQTVSASSDKYKVVLAVVAVLVGVAAFYLLVGKAGWIRGLALAAGVVVGAILFAVSEMGREFIEFAQDAVKETKKVAWPTRKEAGQVTAVVFVFVLVMAIFLWLTDKTLEWVFYDLILGWKK